MFRATNSPILRSTFWLYILLLAQCTLLINYKIKYFGIWAKVNSFVFRFQNQPNMFRAVFEKINKWKIFASCWSLLINLPSLKHTRTSTLTSTKLPVMCLYISVHKKCQIFYVLEWDGNSDTADVGSWKLKRLTGNDVNISEIWKRKRYTN